MFAGIENSRRIKINLVWGNQVSHSGFLQKVVYATHLFSWEKLAQLSLGLVNTMYYIYLTSP